ncbi:hypothetical protein TWF694_004411 [Orbilia ellipsospora]|uniref:Uncharacterized protein n=1 Tax=Orbilia ellipsospora TaxID=2528407 RepID=A0AAV9WWG6_9PEZI
MFIPAAGRSSKQSNLKSGVQDKTAPGVRMWFRPRALGKTKGANTEEVAEIALQYWEAPPIWIISRKEVGEENLFRFMMIEPSGETSREYNAERARNGRVVARPRYEDDEDDDFQEWLAVAQPQHGENVYTIESKDRSVAWTVVSELNNLEDKVMIHPLGDISDSPSHRTDQLFEFRSLGVNIG